MPVKQLPSRCAKCGRLFPSQTIVCPFCGSRRERVESTPSSAFQKPHVPSPSTPGRTFSSAFAAPSVSSTPAITKGELVCPHCGIGTDLKPIRAQSWENRGITLTMKTEYLVRSANLPGYCGECTKRLRKRRLLAAIVIALPFWFLGCIAAVSLTHGGKIPLIILGLYALYIVKECSYSWGDRILYGLELETNLRTKTAVLKPEVARVIFPISLFHALGRLFFYFITTLVLMLAVTAVSELRSSSGFSQQDATSPGTVVDQALNAKFDEFSRLAASTDLEKAKAFLSRGTMAPLNSGNMKAAPGNGSVHQSSRTVSY